MTNLAHPVPELADELTPLTVDDLTTVDLSGVDTIDLFAAAGGWDEGARRLGINPATILGIEWEEFACRTAVAAGHRRLLADIALLDPRRLGIAAVRGIIASPPCQGFSMAGDGSGRRDVEHILAAVDRVLRGEPVDAVVTWLRSIVEDPEKSALVLEPLRWVLDLMPEWTAWEQVPAVLPLWQAIARVLRRHGYRVWTGVLNAADYGVPQTRRRAILIASRVRHVSRPEPTHAQGGSEGDLFSDPLPPWVSMAAALGWGRSVTTVRTSYGTPADVPGNGHHTLDPQTRPAHTVTTKTGDWALEGPEYVGFPRRLGSDPSDPDGLADAAIIGGVEYRARDLVSTDEPSQTVTEKIRSWQRFPASAVELIGGGQSDDDRNATVRSADQPAPTLAFGNNAAQWRWRKTADPASVTYVNGTHDHAARRPADQPAPTILFGERLNTVEWQTQPFAGIRTAVDDTLPPGVVELRGADGAVLGRFRIDDTDPPRYMLAGGIAGDGEPRPVEDPAPTLGGKGTACWVDSPDQWIRADRLADGDTPKGARLYTPGDQTGPDRPPAADPDPATVALWGDRPATTVVASRNPDIVSGPGYRSVGDAPRQEAPGGIRVTVAEAAILQTFPADHPWQGTRTRQYQQVGNAVPPRLAAHVLAEAVGSTYREA